MKLSALGLTPWFKEKAGELAEPEQEIARVTIVDRGWYTIRNRNGELAARATGKFMHAVKSATDMPCVGDWVLVEYHALDNSASIHTLLPRRSFLRRKTAGKGIGFQMIAANIDVAFIVQSCHYDFNVSRLERYLVMASEGNVEPLIILTKTDLVCADELERLISEIRAIGIHTRIIAISNLTGDGIDRLKEIMAPGKTYCVVGSSGVGKSTLINKLTGEDKLRTGEVSESGEGKHTTVRRQLFVLKEGAMLIDTPGMREIGILHASEGLDENFDDIRDLALSCHFSNCGHTNEPRCAILKAIEEGKLLQEHLHDYLKLKKESELNEKAYTNKRKKGKS
ncbi:MAG: ribosome small subunit-dependent GTPase A [bacterium]|nr:ribosome small subunit-dependent GTPase A [bacterium]